MLTPEQRRLRSRIANATIKTRRQPDDELARLELVQLRREYVVVSLRSAIREALRSDTGPTREQRASLAALLTGADE